MKKIPFNIKYRPEIESGKYKVVTRDNTPVRIICWDSKSEQPVIGLVWDKEASMEIVELFSDNGHYWRDNKESDYDLFILTDEPELTDFERAVHRGLLCAGLEVVPAGIIKETAKELLELAKRELLSYADENNPAIEAMADLERTYFCNPDKLPKWLKDDIARKELNAHTKGYNKGYKDAEKQYNESVAYHFPIMPTPPSGWGCDGTHCTNPHHDCINCPVKYSSGGTITTPNTASGTSTAKMEG